jgi:hypothetical protein
MAQKCSHCGGTVTATATDHFVCLTCGASTSYQEPESRGRVENPDWPATYHGDDGVTYG